MKFELTPEQVQKYEAWAGHCNTNAGAIGGRLTFQFTPTGLGDCVNVVCLCGEVLSLTDSENW